MNAKELVLDKINAGSELVSLYISGITLGVPFTSLTDIIISDTINTISTLMKEDSFNNYKGMSRFDQVISYVESGPQSLLGSILKNKKYNDIFYETLYNNVSINNKSIIDEIRKASEKQSKTEQNTEEPYGEDFMLGPDDFMLEQESAEESSKLNYTVYTLRNMISSINLTTEEMNNLLNAFRNVKELDSNKHYLWVRLIDDLELWFDLKELINNDTISHLTDPKYIPNIVYHYSDNENLTAFAKIDNNYFTQFKNGTPNAIFFTDTPSPAPGTFLNKRAKRYAVKLHVDKVKYIYGTKEDLHNLGTDYTEQVNLAESEGYDAVRFIGIDDNQELDQNITVIFDPSKAEIIDDSLIDNNISQQSPKIRRYDEAVKLYRASTEMTALVSHFKLNQGVPTDPNELIAIKTKFESMFTEAINYRTPSNKRVVYKGEEMSMAEAISTITNDKNIFVNPNNKISMSLFFKDAEYRNRIVEAYNAIKEFQNIPYILINNDHYYSYLEMVSTLIDVYRKTSKKFKTIDDNANTVIDLVGVFSTNDRTKVIKSVENSIDTIINNTWLSTTFEPFIIPEGVVSIDSSGKQYVTTAPTPIILGTDWGNKAFKLYIEQKVLVDVKEGRLGPNYTRNIGNKLLNDLIPMIDSDNANNLNVIYTLPIEMIPKTPEEKAMFNSYKDSVQSLVKITYNNGIEEHSLINLLYLYNMVTYNNKVSRYALTGLFDALIQGHNLDLHENYVKFISNYDNNELDLKNFNVTTLAQQAAPIMPRYAAKTKLVKDFNDYRNEYMLYKKGEDGKFEQTSYLPISIGNNKILKHLTVVLSSDISILITPTEIQATTSNGKIDMKTAIEEYNKTVPSDYQVSVDTLLVTYTQNVNGKKITSIDIKLTLENINRILNNPC